MELTLCAAGRGATADQVRRHVVVDAAVPLKYHRVLRSVEGQQRAVQLVCQFDPGLIRRRRIVGRGHHHGRHQTGHGDGMRLARRRHRPERTSAQRRVAGELAVAHERCNLA